MKTTKVNIGLAISRNYDKVSLEILDEPIQHETEEGFVKEVRRIFGVLRGEIDLEFGKVQPKEK